MSPWNLLSSEGGMTFTEQKRGMIHVSGRSRLEWLTFRYDGNSQAERTCVKIDANKSDLCLQ